MRRNMKEPDWETPDWETMYRQAHEAFTKLETELTEAKAGIERLKGRLAFSKKIYAEVYDNALKLKRRD